MKGIFWECLPRRCRILCNFCCSASATAERWETTFSFHAIFFKTAIFNENKIALTEKCFYEDSEYSLYPIQFCEDFYYIPQIFYVYQIGSGNQSVSFKNILKHIGDQEIILKNLFEFYTKNTEQNENLQKEPYIKKRIFEVLNFYFRATIQKEWYKDKNLQKRKKIFYKSLKEINKNLFLEYNNETFLRKILYRTGYHFDGFFIAVYKFLKQGKS